MVMYNRLVRSAKAWHTVRVVVELPVQGGYSERDLAWWVKRMLEREDIMKERSAGLQAVGRLQVKQFNRVMSRITKPSFYYTLTKNKAKSGGPSDPEEPADPDT